MSETPPPADQNTIVYPARSNRLGWLLLGLIMTALLAVGLWYVVNPPQRSDNVDNRQYAAPANTVPQAPTSPPSAELAYVNTDYGFKLSLSEEWRGYEVVTKEPDDANATAYLYFCLPTQDTSWQDEKPGYFCPFAVTAVPVNRWDDFIAENEPRTPTLLGKNTSYALAYSTAQAAPTDGEEIVKTIKSVVDSFVTTNASSLTLYSNPDFGLAFQYPSGWKMTEAVNSPNQESPSNKWLQVDLTSPDGDKATLYAGSIPGRGGPCLRYSYRLNEESGQVSIADQTRLEDDPEGMCANNAPGISGLISQPDGETKFMFEYLAATADSVYLKRAAALIESVTLQ